MNKTEIIFSQPQHFIKLYLYLIKIMQINNKMEDDINSFEEEVFSDMSEQYTPQNHEDPTSMKEISFSTFLEKQKMVDPPRQLPKRSYSLEPDMATGWKPKKTVNANLCNVFPINCQCLIVDYLLKQLYRKKKNFEIVYLGPRKQNSYVQHQNQKYENPYPIDKKLDINTSQRPQIPLFPTLTQKNLKFNSDFQCGNLDAAIFINEKQYDLFMRVDTNTKGHTNWYFFSIQNKGFIGTVKFNICNFRRDKSLYQRGLRPYFFSKKTSTSWSQGGSNVSYQKQKLRYNFLYDEEEDAKILNTYIILSFQYTFDIQNDHIQFAYFIPYSYSKLLKFISVLQNTKFMTPFRSLSGLNIPVLQITNQEIGQYNKKVVLVTGRIHPGQSNSSFIAQGFLQYLCSNQVQAVQIRNNYIFYVVPMLNPDGVVAGNYRTSLFGKDLNRTYNQSRKYAFPETYHLLEFAKQIKKNHKQRFSLFIDLHGHSVKKNIFMYGPDFNIQHPNYLISRELPKVLASLTSLFRFYSCIFKISSEKSSTARATLNQTLNIPFTYTLQSSNGFYYDAQLKKEMQFTSKKLKNMGMYLCRGLNLIKNMEICKISNFKLVKNFNYEEEYEVQNLNENQQNAFKNNEPTSDDNISQGKSDSEPQNQDLQSQEIEKLLQMLQEGKQKNSKQSQQTQKKFAPIITDKEQLIKFMKGSPQINKQKIRYNKKNNLLPPINSFNRARAFNERAKRRQKLQQKLSYLARGDSPERDKRARLSISQMVQDIRIDIGKQEQKPSLNSSNLLKKKNSRLEIQRIKLLK